MIYLISIRRWSVWRGDKDDELVSDKKGFNHMQLPSYILQFSFGLLGRFSESCKIKTIKKPKDSFHLVEKDQFIFLVLRKLAKPIISLKFLIRTKFDYGECLLSHSFSMIADQPLLAITSSRKKWTKKCSANSHNMIDHIPSWCIGRF
jgi:hypothetical protein